MSPTPGPWRATHFGVHQTLADGSDGVAIADCTIRENRHLPPDERYANACLLAAAPKLRAALKAAESILWMAEKYAEGGGSNGPEMRDYEPVAKEVRAALADLEGLS